MADDGWFERAGLGVFIHWGHGSQQGWELSWPMVGGNAFLPECQDVPVVEYHASASTFAPKPNAAREWAALAKRMGARYAVLTTKHHDGFSLFDTKLSDFSVPRMACGRDLVAEYVEAMREAGLRVGIEGLRAVMHWGPVLPIDRSRQVAEERSLVEAGIQSRRTADAHLGSDDPHAEWARVQEEGAVAANGSKT